MTLHDQFVIERDRREQQLITAGFALIAILGAFLFIAWAISPPIHH